jgi:hypothetical protein
VLTDKLDSRDAPDPIEFGIERNAVRHFVKTLQGKKKADEPPFFRTAQAVALSAPQ